MAREEEKQQASEIYLAENAPDRYRKYFGYIKLAFGAGAEWSDNNPDLLSLWHDASEEPEKGELILVEVVNTIPKNNEVRYYVEYVEEWIVGLMKTEGFQCRWAYISDLLPKGGEK